MTWSLSVRSKLKARGGLILTVFSLISVFSHVPATGADSAPTARMTVTPTTAALGQSVTLSSVDPCPSVASGTRLIQVSYQVPPAGDVVFANRPVTYPTANDGSWSVTLNPSSGLTGTVGFFAACVTDTDSTPYLTYYGVTTLLVTTGKGYSLAASDGEVISTGDVNFSLVCRTAFPPVAAPIVGEVLQPNTGDGGWIAGADGGVLTLGYAPFYGSAASLKLAAPVVGIASTPTGKGYWLVAADGGVFNFGDADYWGSAAGLHLNQPIVGMAPSPGGLGYWLVGRDGGIFSFGYARYLGSTGGVPLNQPIVAMTASPSGRGYWLASGDGGVFAFGDAAFHGSAASLPLAQPVVGISATSTGNGYWLLGEDGGVFTFGDAPFLGTGTTANCGFLVPTPHVPPRFVSIAGSPYAVLSYVTSP